MQFSILKVVRLDVVEVGSEFVDVGVVDECVVGLLGSEQDVQAGPVLGKGRDEGDLFLVVPFAAGCDHVGEVLSHLVLGERVRQGPCGNRVGSRVNRRGNYLILRFDGIIRWNNWW